MASQFTVQPESPINNTKARWRWPVELRLSATSNGWYLNIHEVIKVLNLKDEVKKHGYTRIENFLSDEGRVYSAIKLFYCHKPIYCTCI
jgi:hypothetical protein